MVSPGEILTLLALGVAAGVVSTIAGGASVLTTPALIFFGHTAIFASATNFVALSPASFAAVWVDRRELTALTRGHKIICAASFLGTLAGGLALVATGEAAFRLLTPALLGLACQSALKNAPSSASKVDPPIIVLLASTRGGAAGQGCGAGARAGSSGRDLVRRGV